MPEISSLTRQKPAQAVIELGPEDSVTLTFDANRITPAWVDVTQTAINAADQLSLPRALADVVLSWDVTDEGQPYPVTADNLAKFSFTAMGVFFTAIMEAAVPSSEEGNAFADTSSTPGTNSTPTQANPQNGPAPLPSPELSTSQSQT